MANQDNLVWNIDMSFGPEAYCERTHISVLGHSRLDVYTRACAIYECLSSQGVALYTLDMSHRRDDSGKDAFQVLDNWHVPVAYAGMFFSDFDSSAQYLWHA